MPDPNYDPERIAHFKWFRIKISFDRIVEWWRYLFKKGEKYASKNEEE